MAESVFGDKAVVPTDAALSEALGDGRGLWDEMVALAEGSGEWKFYTKAAGWSYPVKRGKRTLFYLLPKAGWFKLTFVLGERAVEAAKTADLPPAVLNDLLQARAYVEGRGVSIDVKNAAEVETAQKLLGLKLAF